MKKGIGCLILILCLTFFLSCRKGGQTQLHLHDKHGLSYELVKNYASEHGAVTLILLDYHHDIRPEYDGVNSANWVGRLVEEDSVKKVIWLSGKELQLPNRNSRMAWLERSLNNTYPETAEKIRRAVELVDWNDLQKLRLRKKDETAGGVQSPFVISLDFDLFTKDPGEVPETFVDELAGWIQKQKPELVTLAFSAAYQPQPQKAWTWLKRFSEDWKARADWFLESGSFGEKIETLDEAAARALWKEKPESYEGSEYSLHAGAYLWQNAPRDFVEAVLKKKIQAGNEEALHAIKLWKSESLTGLKKNFSREKMKLLAEEAEKAMQACFEGKYFSAPEQNTQRPEASFGIAVRFRNAEEDRGCLSLYEGIAEKDILQAASFCAQEALVDPRYAEIRPEERGTLFTNISIFDKWEKMENPFDFEPGLHSLIIEDEAGEKTLLQASIALERNYTREDFLARLANKAGLGFDGWKKNALHFYRAQTITYTNYDSISS